MDVSDSKSRAPCGHEGSVFAKASADWSTPSFGTIKSIIYTIRNSEHIPQKACLTAMGLSESLISKRVGL
jgi:hypothetical protein